MAFSEFELQRVRRAVQGLVDQRRPPAAVRDEVDLNFVLQGQSVIVQEDRRLWDGTRSIQPVAKATWVKSRKIWRLYWMRADLKWHVYEPLPEVMHIEHFCDELDEDPYRCFWG